MRSEKTQSHILSNIWKLNLIQAFRWFMLIMPVIVLFYKENGLSMQDIMVLQALYSLALVIFEVPSGYFSDTIGRRNSLVAGSVLCTIGFFIYSLSHSFFGFLFAEMILGFGYSFISGTDSALLYDTLLEAEKEQDFTKRQGRLSATANFSEAAAGILGGIIAVYSFRLNFYIETGVIALSIPVALSIVEPKTHKNLNPKITYKDFYNIIRETFSDPPLFWLITCNAVILASTLTIVWFVQPYLKISGIPLVMFGVIWTVLNLSVGASSLSSNKIKNIFGNEFSFILPLILVVTGYFSLTFMNLKWAFVLFILLYIARGFTVPVFTNRINRQIPSERRATVLSIRVLLTRIIFCIVGPVSGYISDCYSLRTGLLFAGTSFLLLGTISLAGLLKYQNRLK
jgi:MFS family permease